MNLFANLSAQQLRHAADLKEKIAALQDELSRYLNGSTETHTPAPKRKFKMSAAGRARIIAAQKVRWAKVKAGKASTKHAHKPGKRKMSAAAKAKIAAAARARWARAKAAGKKSL
jgi:hypothetical protein